MSDSPPKVDAGQGPTPSPNAAEDTKPEAPKSASGALDDAAKAMDAVVVKPDVPAPASDVAAKSDAAKQDAGKESEAAKPAGFTADPKPAVDLMQLTATTSGMHQQYVAPGVQRQSFFYSNKWQLVLLVGTVSLVGMFFIQKGVGVGGDLAATGGDITTTTAHSTDPSQQAGFPDPNNVGSPPPVVPQADFTVNAAAIGSTSAPLVKKGDGGTVNKGGYAEETADLEAARLMVDKDPNKALAMCDQHDIDYPRGMLDPEARVIRVEAYAKKGDDAKALALGNDFLEDYPHSPRAGRVVAIVEALKNKLDAGQ